jgi:TPR repeat protein
MSAVDPETAMAVQMAEYHAGRGETAQEIHWWRIAAERGHSVAMFNLAVCLGETEPATAAYWYDRAADAGDREANYNLAMLLERHGKRKEAAERYRLAVEAGVMQAMNNLAMLIVWDHFDPRGTRTIGTEEEARDLLLRAAAGGDAIARESVRRFGGFLGISESDIP